jgi:hypothetical protein
MTACGKECAFPNCTNKAEKGQEYCATHLEVQNALPDDIGGIFD